MPMFISLLSLGCFGAAAASFMRYDGKYFELLILCGVILFATSEITSAIWRQLSLNGDLIAGRLERQNRLMEAALAQLDRDDRSSETSYRLKSPDEQTWQVVNLLKKIAGEPASDGLEDALALLREAGERLEAQ